MVTFRRKVRGAVTGNAKPQKAAKRYEVRLLEVSFLKHYQLIDFEIYFDGSILGHGNIDFPLVVNRRLPATSLGICRIL